jgi:uncharacterized protein (DUF1330 family)
MPADEPHRDEILVALRVTDDEGYTRYRAGMTPLLEAIGGFFRVDYRVSEQLQPASDEPVNRVFILSFPDSATREAFFADPAYLAVRAEHFEPAVARVEQLAGFITAS